MLVSVVQHRPFDLWLSRLEPYLVKVSNALPFMPKKKKERGACGITALIAGKIRTVVCVCVCLCMVVC